MKTVQRHIWKEYEELADDARYTPEYRVLYKQRKETIERVFADAKEKHAMRYTQYRGLAQAMLINTALEYTAVLEIATGLRPSQ